MIDADNVPMQGMSVGDEELIDGEYRRGYERAVQDAVEAVKALPWTPTFTDLWVIDKADAVAAIEALGGER